MSNVYEPLIGETIQHAIAAAVQQAYRVGEPVTFSFNGEDIVVKDTDDPVAVRCAWEERMEARRVAYAASPEGQEATRRAEEAQKLSAAFVEQVRREGYPMFDCADEAAWAAGIAAQKGSGYGLACYRYAAKWANLMEGEIVSRPAECREAVIHEVADACSHRADIEGITGFMYGAAVSILAQCWRHGETLRRWHNLDMQIQDEGEQANRDGGVLNPALLTIGSKE